MSVSVTLLLAKRDRVAQVVESGHVLSPQTNIICGLVCGSFLSDEKMFSSRKALSSTDDGRTNSDSAGRQSLVFEHFY